MDPRGTNRTMFSKRKGRRGSRSGRVLFFQNRPHAHIEIFRIASAAQQQKANSNHHDDAAEREQQSANVDNVGHRRPDLFGSSRTELGNRARLPVALVRIMQRTTRY
jgi:hypothetical protein